jgi:hypothetical protein
MRSELPPLPSFAAVLRAAGTALATLLTIALAIGPWRAFDTDHPILMLVVAAGLLAAVGLGHRRVSRVRRRRAEARVAIAWLLVSGAACVAALFAPPADVAIPAAVATGLLMLRARALARLHARRLGVAILVPQAIVAIMFAVSAVAALAPTPHRSARMRPRVDQPHSTGSVSVSGPARRQVVPTYEQLCPQLPDPLRIGHGLGQLFAHDGAVQAGCGGSALAVGRQGDAWMSIGMCGRSIRSVAIVTARPPVLLYGGAARAVIRDAAAVTEVEASHIGAGDVVLITTSLGTTAYARAVSTASPGTGHPGRCEQVDTVAEPYVQLPPGMTELWAQAAHLVGWLWPVVVRRGAWLFVRGGAQVASGTCDGSACELTLAREVLRADGPRFISIADLLP